MTQSAPLRAAVSAPAVQARCTPCLTGLGLIGLARGGRWTRDDDLDQDGTRPLPR